MRGLSRRSGFEFQVALRYLRTARRDALVRLLSRIAGVGLGVGTAALVLALAALSGFQERLLSAVRGSTPALQLELRAEHDAAAVRQILQSVVPPSASQLLVFGRGWLGGGGRYEAAEIIGYERHLPSWLGRQIPAVALEFGPRGPGESQLGSAASADPGDVVGEAQASAQAVWISERQSRRLGLQAGEAAEVVSPRPTLGPRGPQPRARWLPVAGWLEGSDVEEAWSERVAMPLPVARTLLGDGDRRFDIDAQMLLADSGARRQRSADRLLDAKSQQLRQALDAAGLAGVEVLDWRDRNAPLLFVLRLEKAMVFLAVVLIVLVASFALLSTLHLLHANKTAEIGVLGALGASPKSLQRIFRLVGILLAGSGGVLGGLVGLLLAWALDRFELLRLPGDVYILDHVPFSVNVGDAFLVVFSALAFTFLATAVGARRAAGVRVVEALRR